MDRNKIMQAIQSDNYYYEHGIDIVPTHPELTDEENEEVLRIYKERDKNLTKWPDI